MMMANVKRYCSKFKYGNEDDYLTVIDLICCRDSGGSPLTPSLAPQLQCPRCLAAALRRNPRTIHSILGREKQPKPN